jgi:hypothetical protein
VSAPLQAFVFSSYLLNVLLQLANKNGIQNPKKKCLPPVDHLQNEQPQYTHRFSLPSNLTYKVEIQTDDPLEYCNQGKGVQNRDLSHAVLAKAILVTGVGGL